MEQDFVKKGEKGLHPRANMEREIGSELLSNDF